MGPAACALVTDFLCWLKLFSATKMSIPLSQENIWFNKAQCDDAERLYYEKLAGAKLLKKDGKRRSFSKEGFFHPCLGAPFGPVRTPEPSRRYSPNVLNDEVSALTNHNDQAVFSSCDKGGSAPEGLSAQIAKARQHIKNSLECVDGLVALAGGDDMNLTNKLNALEVENKQLKKVTEDLKSLVSRLEARVAKLEVSGGSPAKPSAAPAPAPAPAKEEEEDDDDVDLFGSDEDEEEDAEKARITAERLKAYHERNAKKPALIAKTNVLFDVKPWDDETDMDEMLKACKSIEKEGLVWGASKLVPVGYGINKLQIMCVVEDEKVSIDELSEKMAEFEDFVQSVDVAAMSKI